MLIGITGYKSSGKSTATEMLSSLLHCEVRSFATPLKEMVCALTGCTMEQLEDYNFKENEIVPKHLWNYCSDDRHNYRSLLQGLGDVMRDVNQDVFVECALANTPSTMIVSDVRMRNEAEAIKRNGGVIIRIMRDVEHSDTHKSEVEIDMIEPDYLIYNNKSIADLNNSLEQLVSLWKIFKL